MASEQMEKEFIEELLIYIFEEGLDEDAYWRFHNFKQSSGENAEKEQHEMLCAYRKTINDQSLEAKLLDKLLFDLSWKLK